MSPRPFAYHTRALARTQIRARIQATSMQRYRAMAAPRPGNSILDAIVKWKPGAFSRTFPDHVRALGGERCQKNVLIAQRVLSQGGRLCTLGKTLGEGGFGRVYEMSVLGLEESLATKAVTVGRVCLVFTLGMGNGRALSGRTFWQKKLSC